MLNYDIYKEKRRKYKKYRHEFAKEVGLWEKEMRQFVKCFKEYGFLPVLDKNGNYRFTKCGSFYPGQYFYPGPYMNYNSVMITRSNISMIGWDQDGDNVGFVKIRVNDLLRKDREEYFLNLYNEFAKNEKERRETEERELYERLKKIYGGD